MFQEKLLKENKIQEYLNRCLNLINDSEKIAIWGAARGGSVFANFLKENNVDKEYFFVDNNPSKINTLYCGKKIISANELMKSQNENILIAITCADIEGVKTQLKNLKWNGKIEIFDFAWIDFDESYYKYIYENITQFEKAYEILSDYKSKEVFINILNYKMSKDIKYTQNICDDYGKQYFDQEIINFKEDEVFIDGGAYNGDSIKLFLKNSKNIYYKIIGFEPDIKNYKALNNFIKDENVKNAYTYNLGLFKEKKKLYFDVTTNGGASSSFINNNGGESIMVDSIDNVLNGEKVTFIKMDVEGSEVDAIIGAEKTIKKYSPTLAICAYHKKEDFYRIPLLIKSINENYKIYFRHYSLTDFETIVYAVCE